MTAGVVENVKVAPPLLVLSADAATVDVAAKSEARPVVALPLSDTLMVQTTANPLRAGLVLAQDRLEAVVGLPYTTNVGDPDVMARLLDVALTTTVKLGVMA